MKHLLIASAALALAACQLQPTRPVSPAEQTAAIASETSPGNAAIVPDTADAIASHLPRIEPEPNPYFFTPAMPAPAASAEEVLARLRERMIDPPCVDHPRVQYWQGRYAASPSRFASQIEAIAPMMNLVLDELDRYRLPGEYALLPIAESWYRPDARGAGDHVGLWQFGRSTAEFLGLPVNTSYDARMNPRAATDAAMRYLAAMHNRFGDWKLATAAFNAGPYRLQKLVETQPDPLFSLAQRAPAGLPDTTFEHLAKIKALACLLGESQRFGIQTSTAALDPLVPVRLPPGQSSLSAIAQQHALPVDVLSQLNPAFSKGFIAPGAPRELLAPQSLAPRLALAELPPAKAPAATATASTAASRVHVVKRGDTLGSIARRHGVKLQQLYRINGLNSRSVLRIGQRVRLAQ